MIFIELETTTKLSEREVWLCGDITEDNMTDNNGVLKFEECKEGTTIEQYNRYLESFFEMNEYCNIVNRKIDKSEEWKQFKRNINSGKKIAEKIEY